MNYLKPKKFNKINEKMFSRHGIQEVGGSIPLISANLKSLKTIGIQGLFHF